MACGKPHVHSLLQVVAGAATSSHSRPPEEIPPTFPSATFDIWAPLKSGEAQKGGMVKPIQVSPVYSMVAYLATACLIAGVIVMLYWSKGAMVIFRTIIYLLANSTMKISVKLVFVDYNFNYPKFVTAVHFLASATVAFVLLFQRGRAASDQGSQKLSAKKLAVPTAQEFWLMIVPIALAFALSVGTNNMALVFCSASFTEIIAAASPLVTILLVVLMGMPFDTRLIWPTIVVVLGCVLSVSGELHFSGVGFALVIVAVIGRSLKTTLQQKMMTEESRDKFDPVALLAWMCIPSALVMVCYSLCVEGSAPFLMLTTGSNRRGLILAILLSCVNACILNLSNLFCVKDLGAVGVHLVAQTKSVLTILGAVALFNEVVTPLQILGFAAVLSGVYWFSAAGKDKGSS
jgi:drug/metabolite transporter (DMT)-like permease